MHFNFNKPRPAKGLTKIEKVKKGKYRLRRRIGNAAEQYFKIIFKTTKKRNEKVKKMLK